MNHPTLMNELAASRVAELQAAAEPRRESSRGQRSGRAPLERRFRMRRIRLAITG
jgi:hypothetical protein